MSLEDFNSEDFEPDIPEFVLDEPSRRAFDRILPRSLQNLIGRAALAAYWKNYSAADKLRRQAGYR